MVVFDGFTEDGNRRHIIGRLNGNISKHASLLGHRLSVASESVERCSALIARNIMEEDLPHGES